MSFKWILIISAVTLAVSSSALAQLEETGGCCACDSEKQHCSIVTAAECALLGGVFRGPGSDCEGVVVFTSEPNLVIDAEMPPATDTIMVEHDFEIADIEIELEIVHSYVGDLCITLQKGNSAPKPIMERIGDRYLRCGQDACCGCPSNNLDITLDDEAEAYVQKQCFWDPPALLGTFRPDQPLSAFKGPSQGPWTISVNDDAVGDSGLLLSWSLVFTPKKVCEMLLPYQCDCLVGGDAICDDGDRCTTDVCDAFYGCQFEPMECPDDQVCDRGKCVNPPPDWMNDPGFIAEDSVCVDGQPCGMSFVYTGESCDFSSYDKDANKVNCKGDPEMEQLVYIVGNDDGKPDKGRAWFSGYVGLEEVFTLDALNGSANVLADRTYLHILDHMGGEVLQSIKLETKCKKGVGPRLGDQFGGLLMIGSLPAGACAGDPGQLADPPPLADICGAGKPVGLRLTYTGGDCDDTWFVRNRRQASCSGDPADAPLVYIVVNNNKKPDAGHFFFDGPVGLNESFDALASLAERDNLSGKLYVHILDSGTADVLQTIMFETSCNEKKTAYQGDQFGSILLEEAYFE